MIRLRRKQTQLDSIEAYACSCICAYAACQCNTCHCLNPNFFFENFDGAYSDGYSYQLMQDRAQILH